MIPFPLFRLPVVCAVAALALSSTADAAPGATPKIESFPRTEVRLTPSRWLDAEKRDDKMLAFILDERELARALFITRYLVEHGMTRRRYDDA